jgi:hypothetical protein
MDSKGFLFLNMIKLNIFETQSLLISYKNIVFKTLVLLERLDISFSSNLSSEASKKDI